MIPARVALLLLAAACWNAWQLLAGRFEPGWPALAVTVLVLILGLAFAWRHLGAEPRIRALPLTGLLIAYAMATIFGTTLIQIGIALCGLVLVIHAALGSRGVPIGLLSLAMLLMPVLPSLDFYLAWPMRRMSAVLTAAMLRLNGFPVGVDGVAISWRGQQLLFDGPCSGVRMLWAALLLASLLACLTRMTALRTAVALAITALLTIPTNAMRAASLFFLETGFLPGWQGSLMHEALGISAFIMLSFLLLWGFYRQAEQPA